MPRRVLIQREDETFDLVEVPAPNEHHLQEIMKSQPQLIPSDDLGLDGDLLVVGRETALASGYIDLLCLARSGDVVLIEFKTGPQNPDFRHALAQLIDYGSDLWRLSLEEFDRGVVQSFLRGTHRDEMFAGAATLSDAIDRSNWQLSADERTAFDSRLTEALTTGDFYYVVAAQRFTVPMQTSLEYMNTMMRHGKFFLVEIVQLEGKDMTAHAAQVVAAPPKRSSSATGTAAGRANEADYLAAIEDDGYRSALSDLFARCRTLGLTLFWGTKGFSIRVATPDRNELLSIAWGFLPGSGGWMAAKNLTLGIDLGSLKAHPSAQTVSDEYLGMLAAISGGKPVTTTPRGTTFSPADVAAAMSGIIQAVEHFASGVDGGEDERG